MSKSLEHKLIQLVRASIVLNSASEIKEILRYLLQTATSVLECEDASILLYDDRQERLFFVAATGSPELERVAVPLDQSIAGEVFRAGKPLVLNRAAKDPRHFWLISRQLGIQVRTLLAVPLTARGSKVGVLEALNKRQGTFTQSDLRLASVLAAQAGVAIANAQMVDELRRAYQALEQANRAKEELLALASHELRTPLGVVLGYASMLQQEVTGTTASLAESLVDAAMKMRAIVEEMSQYALLEEGEVDFQEQVFPLQEVLQRAVDEVREVAQGKGLTLESQWPRQPLWVRGDPEKLKQVFDHLLNNAVRFTPRGGRIWVTARTHGGQIWAAVKDTGIGIPAEELEAIFGEFHQAEDYLTRHYDGLGLGLSIARSLVRLHRGRIWAASDGPGKGSTFTVALPLEKPPAETEA